MSKYKYPKELGDVEKETSINLDALYEKVRDDEDLLAYLKTASRTNEEGLIPLIDTYGLDAVNMICWVIKKGQFDSITQVRKQSRKAFNSDES